MKVEGYIRLGVTLIILIVLAIILYRFRAGRHKRQKGSLEIMEERLEKGEITEEEYERAREKQGK
ncbi:hypothetical protein GCM10008983_04480 [Lentibacillus halophilus]|uniref:SHOCT domain-containing protein n=1 Tax=Lentibacillus halophilus TaxID=295065 RepID=A0ABN0Z3M9_9BACI